MFIHNIVVSTHITEQQTHSCYKLSKEHLRKQNPSASAGLVMDSI